MFHDLCIYHGGCFDGWTAAWIVQQRFPHIELHPGFYGKAPPDVAGRDVVIVDFSYPREQLLQMDAAARSMLVLDHHKTAEADLEGLGFCIFDMNRSGAGMTWDHFMPNVARPDLVNIIEDRDLWRFKFPHTKQAMAFIAAQEYTVKNWDYMSMLTGHRMAEKGEAIQQYIDRFGVLAREQARIEVVGSIIMPTINIPYMNGSDHVNGLLVDGVVVAAGYFRRADGKWQFSLRSLAPYDCSAIAKLYGGGGHAQAAGFAVEVLPWDQK